MIFFLSTTVYNPSSVPENISLKLRKNFLLLNSRHDGISGRMLKFCATLISKPFQGFYKNCSDNECFPQTWKKCIIPIYKKVDKQLKKTIVCLITAYFL